MYLNSLSVINFKNYTEAQLSFCPGINCITGNNGEGKTNILDAIHYLSFCKSFFNPIDSQNIKHEAPFFVIQGSFDLDGKVTEIYCGQKRNTKKQFKKDKKEYERLADHIGFIPLVMISPADNELIYEGSEVRRRFIDTVISQYDKTYLNQLIDYNKVISQRNALLKQFALNNKVDDASLELWNYKLIPLAQHIFETRKKFIEEFTPIFRQFYSLLSNGKEQATLNYNSHLSKGDFESTLQQALRRDLVMEYTTVGIHKDELDFALNNYPIKKTGSQGQQKSYLVALKLAEFEFLKKHTTNIPLLLLDDIYDKLDEERVQHLMNLISNSGFGQVFITDTHPNRIIQHLKTQQKPIKQFEVINSTVNEIEMLKA